MPHILNLSNRVKRVAHFMTKKKRKTFPYPKSHTSHLSDGLVTILPKLIRTYANQNISSNKFT